MRKQYKDKLIEFRKYFLANKESYEYSDSKFCLVGWMKQFFIEKTNRKQFSFYSYPITFEKYFGLENCTYDIACSNSPFEWKQQDVYSFESALQMLDDLIEGKYDEAISERRGQARK